MTETAPLELDAAPDSRERPDWVIGGILTTTMVSGGVVYLAGAYGAAAMVGTAILGCLAREEIPVKMRRVRVKREARRADRAARRGVSG